MEEEKQETSITVKWWGVILVVLGVFAFFFINALSVESRITKLETLTSVNIANIEKNICEIKEAIKQTKQ